MATATQNAPTDDEIMAALDKGIEAGTWEVFHPTADPIDEFFAAFDAPPTEAMLQQLAELEAEDAARRAENELLRAPWIAEQAKRKNCRRCGGTGYLPSYSHIDNGRCFKCG